jgi:hypothetical protein
LGYCDTRTGGLSVALEISACLTAILVLDLLIFYSRSLEDLPRNIVLLVLTKHVVDPDRIQCNYQLERDNSMVSFLNYLTISSLPNFAGEPVMEIPSGQTSSLSKCRLWWCLVRCIAIAIVLDSPIARRQGMLRSPRGHLPRYCTGRC